ncbi:MAG: hypothetical protein AAGK21_00460 [Bacteroidota bacterium]
MIPNPFRQDEDWMRIVQRTPGWEKECPELVREWIFDGRNHDLYDALVFGVSAGPVSLVEPVAQPRGLPDDVTEETRANDHSDAYGHSWLLVREIEEFDWDQPVIQTTAPCVAIEPWAPQNPPPGYPDGVRLPGDPDWEPVGERLVSKYGAVVQCYARPAGRTYRQSCEHFLNVSLHKLRSYGPPDEVRLVVWFD